MASFLTSVYKGFFILREGGWDSVQVYMDGELVFVDVNGPKSLGLTKHYIFVIWWKMS